MQDSVQKNQKVLIFFEVAFEKWEIPWQDVALIISRSKAMIDPLDPGQLEIFFVLQIVSYLFIQGISDKRDNFLCA